MPANKTHTSAQNHLTGMARSHKEPTALWRIIWTSANTDPVGAGHACEQGSHFGAESFTGMARSHKELTALWRIIWTSANTDPVGAGHACEQGSTLRRGTLHGHGPFPPKAGSPAHLW